MEFQILEEILCSVFLLRFKTSEHQTICVKLLDSEKPMFKNNRFAIGGFFDLLKYYEFRNQLFINLGFYFD